MIGNDSTLLIMEIHDEEPVASLDRNENSICAKIRKHKALAFHVKANRDVLLSCYSIHTFTQLTVVSAIVTFFGILVICLPTD